MSTGRSLLNQVLREELTRDPRVVLLGETIRDGGAQHVADGLYAEFGDRRVIETPVSENGIFGAALGLALEGFVPVVEIYSADFLLAVANEVMNDFPKWRQQQRLHAGLPIVIRGCMGANGGLGPEHSQSMEPFLHHAPGLTVVSPGSPTDLAGLLRASIRSADPVVFLEHRRLYDLEADSRPGPEHEIPLSTAEVVREGDDLTIVAWAWMRQEAERAVAELAGLGISAELIDPRTISPMDWPTVIDSVRKTGRLLVAEETPVTGSVAAEIVARVVEAGVTPLGVVRVTMPDAFHPYSASMEAHLLPTADDITSAAVALVGNTAT
jgi:pyruvate/2-oxoglutarate/acetoin dehydrogenase E1 component